MARLIDHFLDSPNPVLNGGILDVVSRARGQPTRVQGGVLVPKLQRMITYRTEGSMANFNRPCSQGATWVEAN